MYGIFTYVWLICMLNVGKKTPCIARLENAKLDLPKTKKKSDALQVSRFTAQV